jgi:hypothetical protein
VSPADGSREESATAGAHDPFTSLDAAPAPGAVTWTHTGLRQAEAGFEDPALGWVGVRAEVSGGGVHAAVVPGSVEAAQELGRQMEGLHAYLAEQRTPVESLSLASLSGRGGDPATGQPTGQNAQGQDAQQQGSGQQGTPHPEPLAADRGTARAASPFAAEASAMNSINSGDSMDLREGTRISVMA